MTGNTNMTKGVTAGQVEYQSTTFTVGGSGIGQYTILLSTPIGKTGELVGITNTYATVGKVAANTTTDNFDDNTWGYAMTDTGDTSKADSGMAYNPMPSGMDSSKNSVIVKRRIVDFPGDVAGDDYKLTFAAKLGENLPADHYSAEVYLSVVIDAKAIVTGLTNSDGATIMTMQEMTSNFCSKLSIGDTGALEDTRDGKKYVVTKLKGNTAGDEANGECWMTQNLAYGTKATTSIGTPCELSRPDNDPTKAAVNGATCTNNTSWSNDNTNKYFAIGYHEDGKHDSQGNFYNWLAAVQNGSGGTNIQGICPPNWQLPVSNSTGNRSFGKLAAAYNAGNNATGSEIMRGEPMFFQYSGSFGSGKLTLAGSNGRYWSSIPAGSDTAFGLYLDSNGANPSNAPSSTRWIGFSVRCVAK